MKTWGFLDDVAEAQQLVRLDVQLSGHEAHDRVAAV
jgi:hypothetical protein